MFNKDPLTEHEINKDEFSVNESVKNASFFIKQGSHLNRRNLERMSLLIDKHQPHIKENSKILLGKVVVDNIYYFDRYLSINVNKNNLPERFEVYLVNNIELNSHFKMDYFFQDGDLCIDLESLKAVSDQIMGEWSFCVKSRYKNYTLIDLITKNSHKNDLCVLKDLGCNYFNDEVYCSGLFIKNSTLMFCQTPESSYLKTTRNIEKKDIYINDFLFKKYSFSFVLTEIDRSPELFRLILFSRYTNKKVVMNTQVKGNIVECFFDSKECMVKFIDNVENGRWDIFGEILFGDYLIEGRLVLDSDVQEKKGLKYSNLNSEESLLVYTTDTNKLSLVKGKQHNVFREKNQVRSKITQLKKKNNRIYEFSIELEANCDLEIDKVALKLRSKDIIRTIEILDIKVEFRENKYKISGTYNINWDDFFPLYWDLFIMVFDDSNEGGWIRVNGATKNIIKKVNKDYFKHAIKSRDGSKIIYPYVTFGNDISFMMRERENYETISNKVKETLAYYTYKLLKPVYFNRKDIWLGFEKFSKTAQDNGYAFFSYVDKNQLHENFYFVIDKNSADFDRIKKESNRIVKFMSFKYLLLVYGSKLLVSSETKRHVHNIRIRSGRVAEAINQKKSVFLQHGVTALKKSDVFKKSKGRGNFDLVVATSDIEQDIIINNWNYSSDEIITTGFSRWDLLTDKSNSVEKRKIFLMPTWRTWMEDMPTDDFIKSEYYLNYLSLLTSEDLNRLLIDNNLELVYFLHPKFKQYISEFKIENDNIKIKEFLDIKVNEEIMEASLMISDYSSVTWDMYYLNKPVIFYQFDLEKYMEYEGSYIDMEEDLFGDRVKNVNELLFELEYYIKHDFAMKESYATLRKDYFKHFDRENSKRIYDEIKKRF